MNIEYGSHTLEGMYAGKDAFDGYVEEFEWNGIDNNETPSQYANKCVKAALKEVFGEGVYLIPHFHEDGEIFFTSLFEGFSVRHKQSLKSMLEETIDDERCDDSPGINIAGRIAATLRAYADELEERHK